MIRSRTKGFSVLAAVLAAALVAPAAARSQTSPAQPTFDPMHPAGGHYHEGEIGEKLLAVEKTIRCNCSCRLDTHTCQFRMSCDVSPAWSQRMMAQLEAGESVESVRAGFVDEFGLTVLMSPPAEGFNLVGYLLPSVAIIVAGMLIGLIVRRGAGQGAPAPVRDLGEEDAARLRDALRELDKSEGPDW